MVNPRPDRMPPDHPNRKKQKPAVNPPAGSEHRPETNHRHAPAGESPPGIEETPNHPGDDLWKKLVPVVAAKIINRFRAAAVGRQTDQSAIRSLPPSLLNPPFSQSS